MVRAFCAVASGYVKNPSPPMMLHGGSFIGAVWTTVCWPEVKGPSFPVQVLKLSMVGSCAQIAQGHRANAKVTAAVPGAGNRKTFIRNFM
jgi:hypothetical protein